MSSKDKGSLSVKIAIDDVSENESIPKLLCVELSQYSPKVRFILCTSTVFFFYLIYGYCLEFIFAIEGIKPHGWFITLVQFCLYAAFALVQMRSSGVPLHTAVPLPLYALLALLTVGTMGFSNASMGYLNYPTQVIFKSCKLIPVMVGSVVILRRQYRFSQVVACVLMCAGLVWFTLADCAVRPNFDVTGVALVSASLCCDAVIGNVQEGALSGAREPSCRLVLYSYGIGVGVIALGLGATGSLLPGGAFSLQHAGALLPALTLMSACGFAGVQAILALVTLHGALTAVTVTTGRKAASIALSFLAFAKPFTLHYLGGGVAVAGGVWLSAVAKRGDGGVAQRLDAMYASLPSLPRPPAPLRRRVSALLRRQASYLRHLCGARPPHAYKFDV